MPRNSSGAYTLPAGNPVASDTLIETLWANPTMSDIAAALTDSLDRNGRGGMLGAFKITDGTVGQPGLAFLSESNTGIWRIGSKAMGVSVFGTQAASFTSTNVTLGGAGQFSLDVVGGQTTISRMKAGGIDPQFIIDSAGAAVYSGYRNAKTRWTIYMPDATAESGANAGSNFGIYRYDDTGAPLGGGGPALSIIRSNGQVNLSGALGVSGCVYHPDGTAAVPAVAFLNQTNTGLYRSSVNVLAVSSNGALVAFFGPNGYSNGNSTATIDNTGTVNFQKLSVLGGYPQLILNDVAGTTGVGIAAFKANKSRWSLFLGDGGTESGGNVSNNFALLRFDDAGNSLGLAFSITRSSCVSTFGGDVVVKANMRFQDTATSTNILWGGPSAGLTYWDYSGSTFQWIWGSTSNMRLSPTGLALAIGQGSQGTPGPWAAICDERLKENIATYTKGLADVIRLRPVTYSFKEATGIEPGKVCHAFIAQEVQPIFPEMVGAAPALSEPMDGTENLRTRTRAMGIDYESLLSLDLAALSLALVNSTRELAELVEGLDVRLTNIEGAIA